MQPLIWLGILAALLFIEAITAGLTTIWFAGGALSQRLRLMPWGKSDNTDFTFSLCFCGTSDFYQTGSYEVF